MCRSLTVESTAALCRGHQHPYRSRHALGHVQRFSQAANEAQRFAGEQLMQCASRQNVAL